jgi:hypothetical protein
MAFWFSRGGQAQRTVGILQNVSAQMKQVATEFGVGSD